MARWLTAMLEQQTSIVLDLEVWLEPFAGGAGAGLSIPDAGAVPELWLVDSALAIAAFWEEAATDSEALANRIERITANLAVYDAARVPGSTLRTCRLEAGPGLASGTYVALHERGCSRGLKPPASS
ncbi:MAG: hypothetical protein ACTH0V_16095, partial [Microbacteriaceae bacterium]